MNPAYMARLKARPPKEDPISTLPAGAADLWLALRRGDDVRERALTLLRDQPQFARDLAFSYAHAAKHNDLTLTKTFACLRRSSDFGVIVYGVGSQLTKLLLNDHRRPSLTDADLSVAASETLQRLAERELKWAGTPSPASA
jgi:hypothetical protein